MIILDLSIVLDDQQEKLLFEKYKDEIGVRVALHSFLDNAKIHECINIKKAKEKAERALNQESKL